MSKSSLPEMAVVTSDLVLLVCIMSKVNGCLKLRLTYKITTFVTPPRVKPAFHFVDKEAFYKITDITLKLVTNNYLTLEVVGRDGDG